MMGRRNYALAATALLRFHVFLFALTGLSEAARSIVDFGAVAGDNSVAAAQRNAAAISAGLAAVGDGSSADRVLVVPGGLTFYIFGIEVANAHDFTWQLDGTLRAHSNITAWPKKKTQRASSSGLGEPKLLMNIVHMTNCSSFTIQGNGMIDGQGYEWWVRTFEKKLPFGRPHMFVMEECEDVVLKNFRCRNSPQFHFELKDIRNFTIRGLDIHVDTERQKALHLTHGTWLDGLPTFPLNTDGIDPAGRDILIQNVSITNFDDAVAVKPSHGGGRFATCSENIVVENARVKFGVGMSIGSVPPNVKVNCVRNVTFRNVAFEDPFKAIYIKTNPGNEGSGIIDNITYENITVRNPIWWGVYIGPQQQHQPDGSGPGCMLYPLEPCETQPRVPISRVVIRNYESSGGPLGPGIMRCNETAPCTGFEFDNVVFDGELHQLENFICEHVEGVAHHSKPVPKCFSSKGNN